MGITFRDLNEKRIAAAWLTPHPTEKIAFVGSVGDDAPYDGKGVWCGERTVPISRL